MSRMISALIMRPGETPRHVNVSGRLDSLQKNVGGVMQVVQLATDLVALCLDRRFDVDEEAPYDPWFASYYPGYYLWARVDWDTGWCSETFYYYAYGG